MGVSGDGGGGGGGLGPGACFGRYPGRRHRRAFLSLAFLTSSASRWPVQPRMQQPQHVSRNVFLERLTSQRAHGAGVVVVTMMVMGVARAHDLLSVISVLGEMAMAFSISRITMALALESKTHYQVMMPNGSFVTAKGAVSTRFDRQSLALCQCPPATH